MPNTRTTTLTCALALLLALVATACSDDATDEGSETNTVAPAAGPDPALVAFLRDTYGIRVTGLDRAAEFEIADNGDLLVDDEFTIEVEGLGSRELYMYEEIYNATEGGGVLLLLEDIATSDYRYFEYNPEDNYLRFSQATSGDARTFPERGATVQNNQDGTYTVWTFDDSQGFDRENEQQAANGYEALRLVEQYNDFSSISPHIMLAAFAFGNTETPEARAPVLCEDTANRPPICTLFKEFCDCVACQTLGRTGADCALCPDLQ